MTVQVEYQLWRSKENVAFNDRLEATSLSYITTCVIYVSIRYQVFFSLILPERDYVRASYLWSWSFWQHFSATMCLSHPLTSVQKFTEIVPGKPLRRER